MFMSCACYVYGMCVVCLRYELVNNQKQAVWTDSRPSLGGNMLGCVYVMCMLRLCVVYDIFMVRPCYGYVMIVLCS